MKARQDSAIDPMAPAAGAEASEALTSLDKTSFLSLPAEIRNAIYEFVICDATLSLPMSATGSRRFRQRFQRRKQIETPLNGLLLANWQLRREYLSILLSTARVVVDVKDFDFEEVARVSSVLNASDVQALQSNSHLVLQLATQNCTDRDVSRLKRWIEFRKSKGADLPWKYEFPLDRLMPGTTMGRVRLLRELEYYADTIATLVADFDGAQQDEVQQIIHAFECKAMELEEDLGWLGQRSKASSRAVRGLAGGGLR